MAPYATCETGLASSRHPPQLQLANAPFGAGAPNDKPGAGRGPKRQTWGGPKRQTWGGPWPLAFGPAGTYGSRHGAISS